MTKRTITITTKSGKILTRSTSKNYTHALILTNPNGQEWERLCSSYELALKLKTTRINYDSKFYEVNNVRLYTDIYIIELTK